MINIEHQGSTTSVILRLRQISELATPYYIFSLKNKNSKEVINMTADDISVAPGLYQEFEWRNGVNGLTAGQFIGDIGEYKVTIYDTQYQYNTSIASASSILLYDTMRVYGTSSPTYISYTQSDSMQYVYYSPDNNGN